jgi:co-chaperonin GroES (HSP10)
MIAIEDKIILEALEPEKLTSGGVILPDTSTEASDRGRVLHVGPGRVEVDGDDVWVIREAELLMIIKRGEN